VESRVTTGGCSIQTTSLNNIEHLLGVNKESAVFVGYLQSALKDSGIVIEYSGSFDIDKIIWVENVS